MLLPRSFKIHNDELFFSVCNRLWRYAGMPSAYSLAAEVTGRTNSTGEIFLRDVPLGIPQVAALIGTDALHVAQLHTLIPYFESTRQRPLGLAQFESLLEDGGLTRVSARKKGGATLRICATCVQDDLKRFGEPIWRRAHVLPGVLACLHHRTWLISACPKCGWRPTTTLAYPATACPRGHRLSGSRPLNAASLSVEVKFACWSSELLEYRVGDRVQPLILSLREHGQKCLSVVNNCNHPILSRGEKFLARATTERYLSFVRRREANDRILKHHPLALLLFLKAVYGVNVNAHEALKVMDAEASCLWAERWFLDCFNPGRREQLILELFDALAPHSVESRKGDFIRRAAEELKISWRTLSRYERTWPRLSAKLKKLRPEYYKLSRADLLQRVSEFVLENAGKIPATNRNEFDTALGGRMGIGRRNATLLRQDYFEFEKLVAELRPEIFRRKGGQGKWNLRLPKKFRTAR